MIPQTTQPTPGGQQPFTRRTFLRLAGGLTAGAVVTAAISACAPPAPPPTSARTGKIQLAFQDCRCLGEQFLLEDFHKSNPNIEVFYTPEPDDFQDTMLADMQSGSAPDVFAGCCDTLPIWAQQGFLLDLRPYVQADLDQSTIDDWDGAQYRAFFTGDGTQFALPKYHGALALYYNKDLFDRLGVPYPDSDLDHDGYLRVMRAVRDAGKGEDRPPFGSMLDVSWERLQVHINGWGGHFVDPQDTTKSWMARPEALTAFEWLRSRMWDDRVMASKLDVENASTTDAFVRGAVAMVEEGSWALKDILDTATFRVGIVPFPRGPQRQVTLATTDGFSIYDGTRQPEAAWELLKFLVSPEYGRAMAKAQLLQPARASLVDDWISIVREQYPDKAQDLDMAAFARGHIEGYSVTAEVFANMADARELARSAWEQIFTLGQSRVDILKTTSAAIEKAQASS